MNNQPVSENLVAKKQDLERKIEVQQSLLEDVDDITSVLTTIAQLERRLAEVVAHIGAVNIQNSQVEGSVLTGQTQIGGDLAGRDLTKTTSQENRENQGGFNANIGGNATFTGPIIITSPNRQKVLTSVIDHNQALANYLSYVIQENQFLTLQGIGSGGNSPEIELEQIYITLRTSQKQTVKEEKWLKDEQLFASGEKRAHHDTTTISEMEVVSVNKALKNSFQLVVLGDPGSGKTTLLRYLALNYAHNMLYNSGRVLTKLELEDKGILPVFLPLRDVGRYLKAIEKSQKFKGVEGVKQLLNCFTEVLKESLVDVPDGFFTPYLKKGKAVLLLDGLDEVADPQLRQQVARLVERLTRVYPKCRYVVTSRIKGYEGNARLQGNFTLSTVQDFSHEDVRLFLTHWHFAVAIKQYKATEYARQVTTQKTAGLLKAIMSNPRIQELAINPLLLTVIALVYQDKVKLPDRRVELYEEAVKVFLSQRDEAKGIIPISILPRRPFERLERQNLLQKLALHLHERKIKEIELADLKKWLKVYFQALMPNQQELPQVVERFLQLIEQRTGLLIARGQGIYSFSHLTFQEYLAAVEITDREDFIEYLLACCGESWWREVILLVASQLGVNYATKLISALAKYKIEPEPYHNICLAADCLQDVDGRVSPELSQTFPSQLRHILESPLPKATKKWVGYRGNVVQAMVKIGAGFWTQPYGEPEWIEISAGEFVMGHNNGEDHEKPAHKLYLDTFWIAHVPTTNAQYQLFIQATEHREPKYGWENGRPTKGQESYPVVGVDFYDALAYCHWLSEMTQKELTLPSEAQWEKAARGPNGRIYPWGNEFDKMKCNSKELGLNTTTPVGIFPAGASPYGVLDMAGNVWEWTRSIWDKKYGYPYQFNDGRENLERLDNNNWLGVLRGGGYWREAKNIHSAVRLRYHPYFRLDGSGFRLCMSPKKRVE